MNKFTQNKGLASLMESDQAPKDNSNPSFIPDLPISAIVPNTHQPRIEIDPQKLIELSDSIREHGVIEPLIVTKKNHLEYELIAGERRWRASKLAGFKKVPVVIKDTSPQQMLELAIIENVQREDLTPIEEAMAFEQLAKKFNLTHEQIAKKVGYSRPAVANKLRLLQLPEEIRKAIMEGIMSEGHGRAILGLKDKKLYEIAFKVIIRDGLSVRATEKLIRKLNQTEKTEALPKSSISPKVEEIQDKLKERLNTSVKITVGKNSSKIIINFKDEDDLENIYSQLLN